ncbi:hypothetical protein RYX56_04845 [Alkalihalophilus lindianensis]|uniref:Triacylglycerol lipase n=1 Tax=Alkalihalophilus lindianensis TaxID=1630542 RepID=A0ABU3X8S3_9BACI|nr:hypothetical protein [Alkalihalophilus lindianensis]MDV2683703.1 hypothetical protein [Alkalihalophilus lindianensis]
MVKYSFLMALLLILFISPSKTFAGSFGDKGSAGIPGHWYSGNTPLFIDQTKAPIVFIHGLNSSSATWWEANDMYQVAYQQGYETAFIDLYPTEDMWTNGALLAEKLAEIHQHFGRDLVLVTHSKGGIDAQSALVHHGAHSFVSNVITLSTPHYGSELADLAYSNWAGWLAGIVGGRNAATNSLQTGYMAYFRSETDPLPHARINPFYTVAGTSWGSFGSSLYWGGLYLRSYGQNDGAVTVKHSKLPYSQELAVGSWNHTTVKEGHATFQTFQNYLTTERMAIESTIASMDVVDPVHSDQIVRGGTIQGSGEVGEFTIENGVTSMTVDLLSDQHLPSLTLNGPNGEVLPIDIAYPDDEMFEGAFHHLFKVDAPKPGQWSIEANHVKSQAYLLTAVIDSSVDEFFTLDFEDTQIKKLHVQGNSSKINKHKTIYQAVATYTDKHGKQKSRSVPVSIASDGTMSLPFKKEGIYTLTIDVKSETKKAYPFDRTFIKSVYVDQQGNLYY